MVTEQEKPAESKGPLVFMVLALLLVAAGYFGYPKFQEWQRERADKETYQADDLLLRKVQEAKLTPEPTGEVSLDWPQWRGPHRDGVARQTGLLARWPKEGPRLVWKVPAGPGYSSVAVGNGRICSLLQDGGDEAIVCWNADDGAEKWRVQYPGRFENRESGLGPHSTPTLHDGKLYVVGAVGMFHCLDLESGKILWKHDLLKEFSGTNQEYGFSFSPLVEGELVIAMSGGTKGSCVAAFNRQDGQLVWKAGDDPAGYSSPMAATLAGKRQIVVLTGKNLMGLEPADGKLLWQFPWPCFKECNVATPIVVGDYIYVSSNYGQGCALVSIEAGANGALEARQVYKSNRMRNHFSTSVYHQDHVYGFDESRMLVCMEFRTGKVKWKQRGFEKGNVLVADGRLIILGENGILALAETNPDDYRELGKFQVSDQRCWTLPTVAHGKLYVRDPQQLYCFDLKAE